MTTIYLVNVGANSSHASRARSPVFADGRFSYVSFPSQSEDATPYSAAMRPFVRNADGWGTHDDPDWTNLTYGDYCLNPRALALKNVRPGDILLFWGMLWACSGRSWSAFTGDRAWFLLGALRVAEILAENEHVNTLTKSARVRALKNAHLQGHRRLDEHHYVFVGNRKHSQLFRRAVPLGMSERNGLIYRAFTSSGGDQLALSGKPAWKSSLRSCRAVWNLDDCNARARAELVAAAIAAKNDYDLLASI